MKWALIYNTVHETNTLHIGLADRGDWKTTKEYHYDDAKVIEQLDPEVMYSQIKHFLEEDYNITPTTFNKEWSEDKTMLIFYGEGADGFQSNNNESRTHS
jgi:hypothetical protein